MFRHVLSLTITSLAFLATPAAADAREILVRTPEGNNILVNVETSEPLDTTVQSIADELGFPGNAFRIDYRPALGPVMKAVASTRYRDYSVAPTDADRATIALIVSTLANKSLTKLWKERDSLEKKGDSVKYLHPLRFLECIFTDEQLKADIRNLKGRDWVWSSFKSGLYDGLSEEQLAGNLTIEQVDDFASILSIDPALILPSIEIGDWNGLVVALIKYVPREGNPGRFDM